jgi:hypothetical protein
MKHRRVMEEAPMRSRGAWCRTGPAANDDGSVGAFLSNLGLRWSTERIGLATADQSRVHSNRPWSFGLAIHGRAPRTV